MKIPFRRIASSVLYFYGLEHKRIFLRIDGLVGMCGAFFMFFVGLFRRINNIVAGLECVRLIIWYCVCRGDQYMNDQDKFYDMKSLARNENMHINKKRVIDHD